MRYTTKELLGPPKKIVRFRELAERKGWGAEEIADRFGVTPHVVRQRLRLGAVSPRLIEVYRDGGLILLCHKLLARLDGDLSVTPPPPCASPSPALSRDPFLAALAVNLQRNLLWAVLIASAVEP